MGAGVRASANLDSMLQTCNAGGIDGYQNQRQLLIALPKAKTVDDFDALLPWSIGMAAARNSEALRASELSCGFEIVVATAAGRGLGALGAGVSATGTATGGGTGLGSGLGSTLGTGFASASRVCSASRAAASGSA